MEKEVNNEFLLRILVETIGKMIENDKNQHNVLHGLVRMVSIEKIDMLLKKLKENKSCNTDTEYEVGYKAMLITEQSGVLSVLNMAETLVVTTAGKSYFELVDLLHKAIIATIEINR